MITTDAGQVLFDTNGLNPPAVVSVNPNTFRLHFSLPAEDGNFLFNNTEFYKLIILIYNEGGIIEYFNGCTVIKIANVDDDTSDVMIEFAYRPKNKV